MTMAKLWTALISFWRVLLIIGVVFHISGCRTANWSQSSPTLRVKNLPLTLPLDRPLTRRSARVWVTFENTVNDKTFTARRLMMLDSGAYGSAGTADLATFKALKLPVVEAKLYRVRDANGVVRQWRGEMVPQARAVTTDSQTSNSLIFENFVLGLTNHSFLIGAPFLGMEPWEIDLDAGVFRFGVGPYEKDAATLDLVKRQRSHYVDVTLNGQSALLVFDTGASTTAIDRGEIQARKLEAVELSREVEFVSASSSRKNKKLHRAKIKVGALKERDFIVSSLPKFQRGGLFNQKVIGLLGYDTMAKFTWRVDWGDEVQFRERRGILETVHERVNRWPWVPRCTDKPGCVSVEFENDEKKGFTTIKLKSTKAYPEKVAFQLACVTPDGRIDHDQPFAELQVLNLKANRVIERGWRGKGGYLWPALKNGKCASVRLIDINPAPGLKIRRYSRAQHLTMTAHKTKSEDSNLEPWWDLGTLRKRLHRWPWMPSCKHHPGCILWSVENNREKKHLRFKFKVTKDYPKNVSFRFACAGPDGSINPNDPVLDLSMYKLWTNNWRIWSFKDSKMRNDWVPIKENRCESIHLVDVLPLKKALGFRSSGTMLRYVYSTLASPDKRFPIKKETMVD